MCVYVCLIFYLYKGREHYILKGPFLNLSFLLYIPLKMPLLSSFSSSWLRSFQASASLLLKKLLPHVTPDSPVISSCFEFPADFKELVRLSSSWPSRNLQEGIMSPLILPPPVWAYGGLPSSSHISVHSVLTIIVTFRWIFSSNSFSSGEDTKLMKHIPVWFVYTVHISS